MSEECQNCGRVIGKLETPNVWNENIVCKACHKQLVDTEPDAEEFQEILKKEPLTEEELAAEQIAHFRHGSSRIELSPRKSKLVAGLLALFLGALGIHNFYLGFKGRGIVQLVLTLTIYGALISSVWAFVEMLGIFLSSDPRDAENRPLN